jgi:ATP-dependent helicase/DNAse subunit B
MQFKRCRQLWDFGSKIRQNYEPNVGIKALDFGTAIHSALEAYYDPVTWNHPSEIRQTAAIMAFTKAIEGFKQKALKVNGDSELVYELEQDHQERMQLGMDMLAYYFLYSEEADDDIIPIRTEVEFEVPVLDLDRKPMVWKDEPVVYQGRVDLLAQVKHSGKYIIVDHKTAAQFGQTDWLALDEQCTSYGWALEHMLGLDISGIMYNQLRKKAPHPPKQLKDGSLSVNKQQDTTAQLFIAECKRLNQPVEQYQGFIDFLNADPKEFVRRTVIKRTQSEYEAQSRRIFMEAIDMLDTPMIYPNPSSMNCNGCQFFQPCLATQDGGDVEWFLDELYTKRKETKVGN